MSKTIENLAKAFIGESQARNRYSMFASVARKEGFEQIAEVFQLTADQEKEHASQLYKYLAKLKAQGQFEKILVEAEMPVAYGKTSENLRAAIAGGATTSTPPCTRSSPTPPTPRATATSPPG